MAWFFLFLAGVCEMAWPIGFKYTNGFRSHYVVIGLTMACMLLSFWLMSLAVNRGIHIGTAYAVWTGLGATGTVILGIMLFNEPGNLIRLICLGVVIVGVIGLKLFSPAPSASSSETSSSGEVKSDPA